MLRRIKAVPTVMVTDCGRGSAVSIIRSLGRRGYRVIAADSRPRSIGFSSVYVQETLVYPAPEEQPHDFVECLHNAATKLDVDLLIPVTDPAILPLSQASNRFKDVCQLALPDPDALAMVCDKLKTLELADQLGVPFPRTEVVESADEAVAVGNQLGWPLVLKPRFSRRYRGERVEHFSVCYAEDTDQLVQRMRHFEGRCPILLQTYHSGHGEGVELLMHSGRPLAAFQHRRLREMPICGGPSALRESVPLSPRLYAHSVKLLEAIGWTGLAMVEFKVGAEGERLMEINGRVWGSLPLAVHSGMDFPAYLADMWLHGPRGTGLNDSYQVGVRSRNLELDLAWIITILAQRHSASPLQLPPRRQALVAMLQLVNPAYRYDILSWKDPRPAFEEILEVATKFYHKLRAGTARVR